MRSRLLSLLFCGVAFALTMVFVFNILNPANGGSPETSDRLTVDDGDDPFYNPGTIDAPPSNVTPQTVTALAHDFEAAVNRLAYGYDKTYASDFAELVKKLNTCSAYLRDEMSDASGSAYLTVLENFLRDVTENPFADNSSFSVRMAAILRDIDATKPAQPPQDDAAYVYPNLDTSPNGSFALAMLSVYRQQIKAEKSVTISVGGQLTVADAVADTESTFDTLFKTSNQNYPLYGVSPLLGTDTLSVTSFANVLTDSTSPNSPLTAIKGKPDYAPSLKASGVDLTLLTGSHLSDYGEAGVSDTVSTLQDAGISALNFSESATFDSAIGKIAVLSYNINSEKSAFIQTPKQDIETARTNGAALVIVVFQRSTTDSEANAVDGIMTQSGRAAIDNGADLVVNYSQSVIQAIDLYKDHYIVYSPAVLYASAAKSSLDNSHSFIFQQSFTLSESGVLIPSTLSVTPVNNGSADGSVPMLLLDESAEEIIDEIAKYSNNTKYTKYGINKSNIDYISIKK